MTNLQTRRQKLTSDIDAGEFNVPNKLVKIGADGKIPDALIPFVFDYGLSFYGDVSEVVDINNFKSDDLKGKGDKFFKDYYVYVLWDAAGAGAAPQGEIQPISDYVSADGTFTHTAFTAPLEENDKVLILHPSIAKPAGREITGSESTTGAEKVLSSVIGQSGKRSILEGGIVRGIQTLAAGKKATIRVYKYNGSTWDLVDKYDVTKDSDLEANIGQAAHNDYMKISVSHDDTPNSKTFPFVFIIKDME